ncbi:hypothetical protein BZA05DRAFT_344365 [Tricharina praecox]|uniref:uncharacterized protein n=1 Tax=Tricharina praecox TaxID=43433 RepID=UPI0022206EB0|nr:uncharacterized protein BZA05DRAFT_344365 [Tricharina praecox]KAI5842376.1 hypothetical protein BZA05DRAFT_344365 [Tricharina praecox]
MCPLPSQTNFKRPYQPEIITPSSSPQPSKRRKSTSKEAWTMTEDDNLLLKLKDEEGLPWKAIAQRFRDLSRGEFRVPTLQMRYKRLKEKMRVWEVEDIQYLKEAKEHIEKQKWELISQRMLEIGCKKKIPGSTCEKKWKEICPQPINTQMLPGSGPNSASTNSAVSCTSDGFPQPCDMKRELSQVSEEGSEGFGLGIDKE